GRLGFGDTAVISRELRIVLLERLEGENDVLGRNRLPIVPFRFRTQAVGDGGEIRRMRDRFSEQAVFGRCLIQRRREKCFVDEIKSAGQSTFPARHDHIEIVVRAERGLTNSAAFWGMRVDVIEVRETGGVFELTEERQSVSPGFRPSWRGWSSLPFEGGGNRADERHTRNREEASARDRHGKLRVMVSEPWCGA